MGMMKRLLENPELKYAGQYICSSCVNDKGLKEYIVENGSNIKCDFCKKQKKETISIDLSELLIHIEECIKLEYTRAIDYLVYDTREGGYQGATILDTEEVIAETLADDYDNDVLRESIKDALGDEQWFYSIRFWDYEPQGEKDFASAWKYFKKQIRTKYRYTFLLEDGSGNKKNLSIEFLKQIKEYIQKYKMIRTIEIGKEFFRGRVSDNEKIKYNCVSELCPPPREKAIEGRMNPKGIPMFYCSDKAETVLHEIGKRDISCIAVASFQNKIKLNIIDFNNLEMPSLFSKDAKYRNDFHIIEMFIEEISLKVNVDKNIGLEYIPTQIITEYLRHYLKTKAKKNIDGICYRSSVTKGLNYVFFCTRENFEGVDGAKDIWFKMINIAQKRYSMDKRNKTLEWV